MTAQSDASRAVPEDHQGDGGRVEISPHAIARVASQAVLRSYGVVGMAAANLASDIAATLSRDPTRGVRVHFADNRLVVDLYVVIEYGTRISMIAQNIIDAVRYDVEKTTGIPVAQVNVHVQGLRVSDT
ncbi:MAG: Asp23/Gls24 family envelope stress response protein [Anaerolineae bacterium]|nr:Asp23/Gls24 family envelope stress response protein [Anaerolineae bacterium]